MRVIEKKKQQWIKLIGIVVVCFSVLVGCQGAESTQSSNEKNLNVALFWVSTSLDPAKDYDGWVLSRIGVGETLLKLNEQVELEHALASSWEQVDENTWEFTIRDGVTFSNGKVVDASAVKASLERAYEGNSRATEYFKLQEIQAQGQVLTIKTSEPSAALLHNLCEPLFTIIDVEASQESIDEAPICTGPYVVTEFTPGETLVCKKNNAYWDGEPGVDTIYFTQVEDSDSRVLALQSGEIDLTGTIDYTNLSLFQEESKYQIYEALSPRTNVIYMNNENEFLSNHTIRQALSYATNREQYAQLIGGEAAVGLYSSVLSFGKDLVDRYAYDMEKAMELLEEASYVDEDGDGVREINGKPIVLNYYVSADHGSSDATIIAQALQADAKAVGIEIQIVQTENLSDIRSAGAYDLCSANDSTAPTGDPQVFLEMRYKTEASANYQNYSNEVVDEMITKLSSIFDIEERQQAAREISQLILEDAASLYISYIPVNTVTSARVKGAIQHPIDYYMITKDITVE